MYSQGRTCDLEKGKGASHPLVFYEFGTERAVVLFCPVSEFGIGKRVQILTLVM